MDDTFPQTQSRTALRRPVRTIPQAKEDVRFRISNWMGWALIITAGSIDIFQAILNVLVVGEVFSTIISVCADVLFIVWFWILGLGFTKNPKNFLAMGSQAVIGLIPVINTLPELTLGITAIVLITRSEDKGGIIGQAVGLASGKTK
jgi:hypothetical protein